MDITDVRMKLIDNGTKMRAVASITIDDAFVIHDIRVIDGERGVFVAMPSKKDADGTHHDICHPATQEARIMIKDLVLSKYDEVLALEDDDPDAE